MGLVNRDRDQKYTAITARHSGTNHLGTRRGSDTEHRPPRCFPRHFRAFAWRKKWIGYVGRKLNPEEPGGAVGKYENVSAGSSGITMLFQGKFLFPPD